jgi:hypothetical protein
MSTTRTITVRDHEVYVRTIEVPDEKPAKRAPYTAITGGHRTAVWTAAAGILVLVVALMPTFVGLFH